MDVDTIAAAFGCSQARAQASHAGINAALLAADCTTVRRCAMYAAQVGHETLSLIYDGELWGPTAQQKKYDPASGSDLSRDLGNTQPGDGYRYRGRGRIQLTGAANYGAFSRWAHGRGLVPAADHFVRHPDLVADAPWRDLAAAWYWTVARPGINPAADRGDVREVTRLINGGANGLADRQDRYTDALRLGDRLLPDHTATTPGGDEFDMATLDELRAIIREEAPGAVWHHPIPDWYREGLPPQPAFAMLAWSATHGAHARDAVDTLRAELRTTLAARTATAAAVGGAAPAPSPDELVDVLLDALARVGPLFLTSRNPDAA